MNDKKTYQSFAKNPNDSQMNITYQNGFPTLEITNAIVRDITEAVIGTLKITIDASSIISILDDTALTDSDNGSFYIVSPTHNLSFQQEDRLLVESAYLDIKKISNKEQGYFINNEIFYVYGTSKMTNWKVIGQAPIREIIKDSNEIRTLIVLTVFCSIIFIIGLYIFISNRLIHPIRLLKDKMKQAAQGNLEAKVDPVGEDEIATLGDSFNQMIVKIKSLLDLSIDEEKKVKSS
ncbi:methyl-accepting chemotaxis protein [Gracilibacillus boraciitolerans JCM 21714]|uniref:histidine kinase n=2 Tax=Gracilibacillus boraciitolerans TaxID=307521 RepID=W4VFV7_9BACI|nr:methyl-accepting chemotaxis protein [Gracilibacillus boraciitolerans JCM 21714]